MKPHIVFHEIHGRGKVISTRSGGKEFCVDFERGPTRWVWGVEVSIVGPDELAAANGTAHSPETPLIRRPLNSSTNGGATFSRAKERRILHALRLGIVPDDSVIHFTFGRDAEVSYLLSWLEDESRRCLYVTGSYGSGKTHLLNHIAHQAYTAGFAVASIQVDEKESPFHQPLRVYQRLASSLTFHAPQIIGQQGVHELLQMAINRGLFGDHEFFKMLRGQASNEHLLRWITGNGGNRPPVDGLRLSGGPRLVDHSKAANLYCYLLSGLGWAAQQLGLRGLVLIFDEAETLTVQSAKRQREMGYNFFGSLYRTASNESAMLGLPATTGFEYSRAFPRAEWLPFLYKEQSGLKLIFAFAVDDGGDEDEEGEEESLSLSSLSEDARRSILDEIIAMYRRAYQFDKTVDADWIFEIIEARTYGMTRQFVKGCVEALDLIRHSTDPDLDEVLQ